MIKPYEYICKENFSFFKKLLTLTKMDEGLDFTFFHHGFTDDNEEGPQLFLHTNLYKSLRVRAERNGGDYIYSVRISYTINSNNYAPNFFKFIDAKKKVDVAAIKKCHNCRTSEIILNDKDVIYSKGNVLLNEIKMKA